MGDWLLSLYDRLLNSRPGRWLPGRGAIRTVRVRGEPQGFRIRLGTSDLSVVNEIFVRREYDTIRDTLQDATTVLDLGANIGLSVRLWRSLFPEARIVAVEPDPANLEICRLNNPGDPRLTLVPACVAGTTRRVLLNRSGPAWSYRMEDAASPDTQALAMADLLRDHVPGVIDLLKCDIEGAEAEVFATSSPWIDRVRHLVVEVHRPYTAADLRAHLGPSFTIRLVLDFGANALVFASRTSPHTPGAEGIGGSS